ncbi:MAG: UDP-N-acetylmuramoyl-L-alanine--D-glutamate ligase [Pseudomonadota bacterium]
MIPAPGYEGQQVGVLGLARSGLAAARALAEGGATPLCWDDAEAGRARAEAEGFTLADLTRPREAESLSALIVSPGIPHLFPHIHPAIAAARAAGVPVDNDIGLWFRAHLTARAEAEDFDDGPPPKVIAITGSNGKSTTTALITHILNACGRPAQMGGNIGRAVFDLAPPEAGGALVIELSSYQIELARTLAPDIAVFLNLSPDHLDRHGGLGGYFAAKRRLFDLGAPERAVVAMDDDYGVFLADALDAETLLPVATTTRLKERLWSVFMAKSHLSEWRGGKQIASVDLREAPALIGRHNHQNAVAAWAVARTLGLAPRRIEAALKSFKGLAHRMERLGQSPKGVLWINDSKATNAEAAATALASLERVRWIAGGRAKEGGLAPLAPHFERITHAYLIGEAAPAFAADLGTQVPHSLCATLDKAVAQAQADAAPGETVLLSPAAASFDQFADFEARGEAFKALATPHLEEPQA